MSIRDVIERARHEQPYSPPHFPIPGTTFVCRVREPAPWDKREIERGLGVEIPDSLATLWTWCDGMVLYEESTYQQAGLIVLSPQEAQARTLQYRADKSEHVLPGDVVFGEFYGDLRLALVRGDKQADDCGAVVIVAEMDPRLDWYTAAASLDEFLTRYMDSHGDDYWDVHYDAIKARRARGEQ